MRIDSLRLIVLVLLSSVVCIGSMYSMASIIIAHWVFPHHTEGSRWVQEGRVESQWIALYARSDAQPGAGSLPTDGSHIPIQPLPTWMQAHLETQVIFRTLQTFARPVAQTVNHGIEHPENYHPENYHEVVSLMVDEFLAPFLDQNYPTLHEPLPMQPITINTPHRQSAPSPAPQWMLSLRLPTASTHYPD